MINCSTDDCPVTTTLGNIENHLRTCEQELQVPVKSQKGCGLQVKIKDQKNHSCMAVMRDLIDSQRRYINTLEGSVASRDIPSKRRKLNDARGNYPDVMWQWQMWQRMAALKSKNLHVYEAVRWLRQNTQLFNKKIYEPMLLLINLVDPRDAAYVESHIPKRELYAFVCEDKDDFVKFIRLVRTEMKLGVSAVCSGQNYVKEYSPSIDISQLRKYGFRDYMINLFTAPAPITNYLCAMYRTHDIPVGDNTTDGMVDDVMANTKLSNFYSHSAHYMISRCKYSKNRVIRSTNLSPATLL